MVSAKVCLDKSLLTDLEISRMLESEIFKFDSLVIPLSLSDSNVAVRATL